MFCVVKGHLLHIKRACFAMQKGVFYIAKGHVLFGSYESLLQKGVVRGEEGEAEGRCKCSIKNI